MERNSEPETGCRFAASGSKMTNEVKALAENEINRAVLAEMHRHLRQLQEASKHGGRNDGKLRWSEERRFGMIADAAVRLRNDALHKLSHSKRIKDLFRREIGRNGASTIRFTGHDDDPQIRIRVDLVV